MDAISSTGPNISIQNTENEKLISGSTNAQENEVTATKKK
jgi:hypothetical protein